MQARVLVLVILSLFLGSCGKTPTAEKGDKGDPGAAGPAGPAGPPGPPGRNVAIRFAEFACQQPACSASCEENERLLNAYAVNAAGAITINDDRAVTYRPARRGQAGKLVLACVSQ